MTLELGLKMLRSSKEQNDKIVSLRKANIAYSKRVSYLEKTLDRISNKVKHNQETFILYLLISEAPIVVKCVDIGRIASICGASKALVTELHRRVKRDRSL